MSHSIPPREPLTNVADPSTGGPARDLGRIMHTLGQIAGAMWPNGAIPRGIQSTLLSAPHRGFDMMVRHRDFSSSDIDSIVRLLDQVPEGFNAPVRGITEENHRQFWAGFSGDTSTT